MVTKLIVASGKSAGRSISLKRNKLLIGRAEECDVRPLSEEVSRRHCAVTVGPTDVWVEDLKSRNGTYVNGKRIESETRIKVTDGDLIRVGSLELRVSCQTTARGAESESVVSRWLGDDSAIGAADTTSSLPAKDEDSATVSEDTVNSRSTTMIPLKGLDEVREAAEKSGIIRNAKKPESSRDAAAEALKKFFERK
jgi:pSer/pThr/pTyr-binding forkhead associated (FHA) protein